MLNFRHKLLDKRQPSHQSTWLAEQRHFDTIVFVHGIIGKYQTTWGGFQTLLATDDDLPILDIYSWGYKSGFIPGSYQDVETEGDSLIGDIESLIRDGNQIFLVGHSMGGLVILKGVTNRIYNEGATQHPVKSISRIVLYATPLLGSAVANVVLAGLQINRYVRWILKLMPGKQLADLRRGTFCADLLKATNELVYRPHRHSALAKRAIPVLACAAKQDAFVAKESATGIFVDPDPKYLEGSHTTVKLPEHHGDTRYLALKNQLIEGLTSTFHELCLEVRTSPDPSVRMAAAQRLDEQYGEMMLRCAKLCVEPRAVSDADLFEFSALIWSAGARLAASPAQVMAQVYREYRYKNDPRLTPF